MKKIFITSILFALAVSAGAQNMYDAMTFSQNNYAGSARSIAMGNAVTALGGDLGMIGINPAGSAVASYSQIMITPGLQISTVSSAFSNNGENAYGIAASSNRARMNMPNVGVSLSYDTRNSSGLRRFVFALVCNQSNTYDYASSAYGNNSMTSKGGEAAWAATGISESVLSQYNSFNNSDVNWDLLAAYQGGAFSTYGYDGYYVATNQKIGRNASHVYVPGNLSQVSDISKTGNKRDVIVNFGFNYSDKLYVGVNFGMPSLRYNYYDTFTESAVNTDDFPISYNDGRGGTVMTNFKNAEYAYHYSADVSGIYMKIGAIYLPDEHFRLGVAVQTPSLYTISETWQNSCYSTYTNSGFNASSTSPVGEYSYSLLTPYEVNLGLAYTTNRGLISVDYEMTDYHVMRFSEVGIGYRDDYQFRSLNQVNRNFAGLSHSLRVGGEFKLTREVSLRAGYSFLTGAEKHWTNSLGDDVDASAFYNDYESYSSGIKRLVSSTYYKEMTRNYSFGIGYSSPGSFFADFAVRYTKYPSYVTMPYYDYDAYDASGAALNVQSPRILSSRALWAASLTFGWRF